MDETSSESIAAESFTLFIIIFLVYFHVYFVYCILLKLKESF